MQIRGFSVNHVKPVQTVYLSLRQNVLRVGQERILHLLRSTVTCVSQENIHKHTNRQHARFARLERQRTRSGNPLSVRIVCPEHILQTP